jgi:hypothetical protein
MMWSGSALPTICGQPGDEYSNLLKRLRNDTSDRWIGDKSRISKQKKVKRTVYWNTGNPDIHAGARRQVSGSALF